MTAAHRLKDLADVQQLIETLGLTAEFADRLNPFVRDKFLELRNALSAPRPAWEEPTGDG